MKDILEGAKDQLKAAAVINLNARRKKKRNDEALKRILERAKKLKW